MTYDGTIRFDTRIDTSDLDSQMSGLESKLSRSAAKLRDVMQGPIAAFKEMAHVAGQIKGGFDKLEAAWASQERASAILKATLEATGASAWTSAKEIEGMAESLQDMTAYGDDAILTMQNVLLGFKNIKGDNFKEATTAILDMATVMGMDLTSAAQAVGKALDDPVQGMDSLSRQGFKFTEQQKDMLKALVESGKIEEAQGIILKELATTYGGAAEAAAGTASAIKDKLNNALGDLQEEAGRTISEALKPMRVNLIEVINGFTDWFKVMNENGDMPELLNKITTGLLAVTAAMAEFVLVSKGAAIVNTMTLAIQGLSKALAANWVALAAAGAVAAITLIIGKIKEHKLEQEEAARAAEEQARKTDELKNSVVSLATEYQNLYDKTNPTADEQQRMLDIANQLHTLYPTLTNDVIEYAAKNSNLATSIKEVALAQERVNLASLLGKKEAINQNIIEVQLAKLNAKTDIERTTYENMQAALEEQLKKVQGEIKIVEGRIAILNKTTEPTTAESAGGTVPSKEAPKVEKSQGERLQELDAKYKAQIEAEKELGHDTTEIERQYYKERYDLLMDFIAEDAKAGLSFENSFKSRLKGLNTTLGDELAETDRILSDFDAADTAKAKGDAYTKYVESNYTEIENIEDNYEKESLARLEARNKKRISLLAQLHGKEADYIASEAELQEWLAGRYEWASEEELLDLQSKLSEKKRADAEAIEEAEQYNDYISSLDSEQQGKEDKYEQESLKRLEERNKKRLSLLAQLYGHSADYIATEAERQEWLAGRYEWASDEEIAALQEQLNERKRVNAEAIADQQQYSNAIDKADSELQKNEDEYEQEALNRLKARNKERLSLLAQLHGKSADYIASEGEKQEWLAGRYEWASDEEIAALRAQLEEQKKAEAVQKAREAAYNTYIENRYKDTEEIEDEYEQESLNRLKERNKKRLSLLAQLHGKEADYVATEAERQEWLAGRYEWASDEEIIALQSQLSEKKKADAEAIEDEEQYNKYISDLDSEAQENEDNYEKESQKRLEERNKKRLSLLAQLYGHSADYVATEAERQEWLVGRYEWASDEEIAILEKQIATRKKIAEDIEKSDTGLQEKEDEYEKESLKRLEARNKKRLSLLAQLHGKSADYVASEAERQEWLAGRYEWASDEEIEALQKQLDEKIKVDDEIKKRDTEYINLLKIVNGHTEDYQATQEELVEWLGPNFTHATDEQIRAVKNYLRALGLMSAEYERIDAANGADAQSTGHVATGTEIMTDKVKKATEALKEQADAINNSNQSLGAQIRQLVEFARAAGVSEDAIDALVAAWNNLKQAELQANADKGSAESQALTLTWTEMLTRQIKEETLALGDQIKVQELVNQGYDANIAQMILAAQSAGVDNDAIDALIESYINLKKAQENKSIWQQAGIVGEKSITGKVSGGTEVGNLLAGFGIDFGGIIGEMVKSIASLSSVTKLLNPIATIFDGIMSTLGPVIDEVFAPLAKMLTQVGIAIGQILAPALQVLMPIIQTLAKLFVKLYNDVIVPVGDAVIKAFNWIFNAVADVINWILGVVNKALGWLVGNIALIEKKGVNSGLLTPISEEDLSAGEAEELEKVNEQLKKNRELFTLASKAADAYKAVLTKVKTAAADFYDSLKDVGSDIADSIINGILNGFSSEDFAYEMQEYLTKAVVKAAVFTESFMAEIAEIGAEIANGIANGFSEDQLRDLRNRLAELYNNAQAAAEVATSLVQDAFTAEPTVVTVPSEPAPFGGGGMIIPGSPGATIDLPVHKGLANIGNYVQALMPRFGQAIQAIAYGTVNIDGREIGRIAFDYSDQFQRAMYGA